MRRRRCQGMTLAELLVATTIMTFIAVAVAALFQTAIQTQTYAQQRQDLYREAFQMMTRIGTGLKNTSHPMVPNGAATSRPLLIFSANTNQDNDYYQSNTLLPRCDEDPSEDITNDGAAGVVNVDDNLDLIVDGLLGLGVNNDDEDLPSNEDKWNGITDDSDTSIDEDPSGDLNADNKPGISGMDDDWDNNTDEGNKLDDDEDGFQDEDWMDPIKYSYNSGTGVLTETFASTTTTLTTKATAFTATYEAAPSTHAARFLINLSLTDTGQTVTLSEYVFPRNLQQRTGKKVR